MVGIRRWTARRAHHPASPRWARRRRRLSGASLLPLGEADRGHTGRLRGHIGAAGPPSRGRAPMTFNASGLKYDDVAVGDELPPLEVPLTKTLIVATAIASRDYQDVHHDPGLAEVRGSPDIFMNILSTNGFVGRFITDWSGPDAVLKSVKIRLGAPNYPGDTMTMTGKVEKKEGGLIEVSVRGANKLGDHVAGTVTLELSR